LGSRRNDTTLGKRRVDLIPTQELETLKK